MQRHQTKSLLVEPSPATKIAFTIILTIATVTIFCRPLTAQIDADQSPQNQVDATTIKRQVSLLGDANPTIRQNAQTELRRIGVAAVEELEKAAKFETTLDYETQIAAAKILESIRDEIAVEETNKFVRGSAVIPGWQDFEKFTGDTKESRSLFRDIYLRNRLELAKALRPAAGGNLASYAELKKLFESQDLEQVCLGMFLLASQQTQQNAVEDDTELPFLHERPSEQQLSHLLSALVGPASPLKKLRTNIGPAAMLVRAVIETIPPEYPILSRKLYLVEQIDSPEMGPLLVKLAAPENPTVVRALAIAHAIKIGDAETFAQLQTYLNDDTVLGQFLSDTSDPDPQASNEPTDRSIVEVRIQDIVLLGNLRLAKQAHTDFGFDPEAIDISDNQVDVKRAGFINNEDRKKAFERYEPSNQQ